MNCRVVNQTDLVWFHVHHRIDFVKDLKFGQLASKGNGDQPVLSDTSRQFTGWGQIQISNNTRSQLKVSMFVSWSMSNEMCAVQSGVCVCVCVCVLVRWDIRRTAVQWSSQTKLLIQPDCFSHLSSKSYCRTYMPGDWMCEDEWHCNGRAEGRLHVKNFAVEKRWVKGNRMKKKNKQVWGRVLQTWAASASWELMRRLTSTSLALPRFALKYGLKSDNCQFCLLLRYFQTLKFWHHARTWVTETLHQCL